MINLSVFNNPDATEDELIECCTQASLSDYIFCRICQHHSFCVGMAMKSLLKKLNENKENNNGQILDDSL